MEYQEIETTVLVVGAGPAGITMALALAQYGVAHHLVEQYAGTAHMPRAHIVNQRTTEIMRHLGVEDHLLRISDVEDLADMTVEEARGYIEAVVGEAVDEVEIKGVSGWTVNRQLAKTFSAGGIFCVGDAVHRHPPSSGLGLNMSVADSYNLAWKIALVDRGVAGPQLLETYDTERRPIDGAGVERAVSSLIESLEIADALGLVEGQSEAEGWAVLAELDDPSPVGDARRAALDEALGLAHLQFDAVGLEVGYAYERGALVQTEAADRIPARQPILEYKPTSRPGNRVPHARLERDGLPVSSIDLVDGLQFALLVGLDGDVRA